MTKPDCIYYNWNSNPRYCSYPREYGARCEFFRTFFTKTNDTITPDCETCPHFEIEKEELTAEKKIENLLRVCEEEENACEETKAFTVVPSEFRCACAKLYILKKIKKVLK